MLCTTFDITRVPLVLLGSSRLPYFYILNAGAKGAPRAATSPPKSWAVRSSFNAYGHLSSRRRKRSHIGPSRLHAMKPGVRKGKNAQKKDTTRKGKGKIANPTQVIRRPCGMPATRMLCSRRPSRSCPPTTACARYHHGGRGQHRRRCREGEQPDSFMPASHPFLLQDTHFQSVVHNLLLKC